MRVVVDTNVLVAGLVAEGLCRDIVKRRLPVCQLFASKGLIDELTETLRVKFDVNATDLPWVQVYKEAATLVKPKPLPRPVCRDPDDDVVLATALAARAQLILTGDNDLLVLKEFEGIRILSPRQFVEWMDRQT